VIANSSTTLSTLTSGGNSPSISRVIPYPLQAGAVSRVSPNGSSLENEHFTVGMVGRIAPWKGQHVFLDAFAEAFPGGGQRAVIVGAPLFGEDLYGLKIKALAAELGLDGRVQFTGFQGDVYAQLARFNVLVHASIIPEPFGQVIVEGMAAGLPVVAPAEGGPSELIEDGVTGMLYPLGDRSALARILRRLSEDRLLCQRLGAEARRRALDFAPQAIAAQVLDLYNAVLPGRQSDEWIELVKTRGPSSQVKPDQ
jgi:glycosyltransferase involved in cell wall biosynthesis